jgi:hypothetical protein
VFFSLSLSNQLNEVRGGRLTEPHGRHLLRPLSFHFEGLDATFSYKLLYIWSYRGHNVAGNVYIVILKLSYTLKIDHLWKYHIFYHSIAQ